MHATARPRRATADCDRVVPDSRLSLVASIDGRQGVYTLYVNVLTAPPAIRLPLFHGMGALACLPGREQRRRAFESPTLSEPGMGNFRAGHRETGRERGRFRHFLLGFECERRSSKARVPGRRSSLFITIGNEFTDTLHSLSTRVLVKP